MHSLARNSESAGTTELPEQPIPGIDAIDPLLLPPVMPANAGSHDLSSSQQSKSWLPAFAGMIGGACEAPINPTFGMNCRNN